jgi:hypothetical protein
MRKWILTLLTCSTVALSAMGVVACGDDSSATVTDAGSDGSPTSDGSTPVGDSGPGNTDAGCTFASYVIGLEGQPGTATPDPSLGANCKDTAATTTQDDFKSLFQ